MQVTPRSALHESEHHLRHLIQGQLEYNAPKGMNPVPGKKGCAEAVVASSASSVKRDIVRAVFLTIGCLTVARCSLNPA